MSGIGSRSLYTTSTIDQVARFWVAELLCGTFSALPLIDLERARCTILVGTNPPVSHGHVGSWPDPVQRLRQLASQGDLWCLDVRQTETAAIATHHLAPRPGTDWAVLGHVVRAVLAGGADQGFLDAHASGLDGLRVAVEPLDQARAAAIAGVDPEALDQLVASVREAGRVAVNTGTGATMGAAGDVTEWMAWALMAVTGSLDRPGGVWFNRGLLGVRRRPGSPPPEPGPASRPGLLGRFGERPTAALVDEIERGNVRALIVTGGNPLRAVPGSRRLATAFERLEVLAVADILATATVAAATHVLACAAQLERSDIAMVESMYPARANQYTPALLSPAGATRPLFDLYSGLGQRLGLGVVAPDAESLFDALAGRQAERLRRDRILLEPPELGWFTQELLADQRWSLAPDVLVERLAAIVASEAVPAPLVLTPRREVGHMNTLLAGRSEQPALLVAPVDAARLGLADGERVAIAVAAGSGAVEAVVRLDPGLRPGVVSLPHGYDDPNIADLTTDTAHVHPAYGMPTLTAVPVLIRSRERP